MLVHSNLNLKSFSLVFIGGRGPSSQFNADGADGPAATR